VGEVPELYQFFLQQPKDTLIASLAPHTEELPSFTKRSILVSREHALPYHKGYYAQFRQRTIDQIKAEYSDDLNEVKQFIQKYRVDFWLLDRTEGFMPDVNLNPGKDLFSNNPWLRQFPPAAEARSQLEQGKIPALVGLIKGCSVFQTQSLVVLKTTCIMDTPQE
jgi:hypothetical protein